MGIWNEILERVRQAGILKLINDNGVADTMVPDKRSLIKLRFALYQRSTKEERFIWLAIGV